MRRLITLVATLTLFSSVFTANAAVENEISFVYQSSNFGSEATITGSSFNAIAYLEMRIMCPEAWYASMTYPPYCVKQTFVGPSGIGLGAGVEDFISKSDTQIVFRLPTWVNFGSPALGVGYRIKLIGYNSSFSATGVPSSLTFTASTSAPGAPTIGTALALSPTSASISFSAPASDGGAAIETYTATSTPGSFTGQLLQAGSGSITVTGLTSSTTYTFTVTASNRAGTSSPSSASVSITTPASEEELAEQAAQAIAARDAAARAASEAAAAKSEADKRAARAEILTRYKNSEKASVQLFALAEIPGITKENIEALEVEILAHSADLRAEITQVLKMSRKYEVVGIMASDRIVTCYSNSLIEIGLIHEESKHKAALMAAIKKLPVSERSSYATIKETIDNEMAEIQARKDRLATVLARVASRNG
jgi:chitodextrinase